MTAEPFCWSPTVGEADAGAVVTLSASWTIVHAGPVAVGVQPGVTVLAPVNIAFRVASHHRTNTWLALDVHTNISPALWVREWGTAHPFLLKLYRTAIMSWLRTGFDSQYRVLVRSLILSFHLCRSLPRFHFPLPSPHKTVYTISQYVIFALKKLHKACERSLCS